MGKPGEAIKRVVEENNGKIATIIMIDAALKLEGEKPGAVAEGVGAAIGGPGTEQYKIEESILKYKIPVIPTISALYHIESQGIEAGIPPFAVEKTLKVKPFSIFWSW